MNKEKSFDIPKAMIWQAWLSVKSKQGAGGVDGVTIEEFEADRSKRLYKIWNRLSSGSYMPSPVKRVEIPKRDGGIRPLGIPTIEDRVAQMVVTLHLAPKLEELFHSSSFGYRPAKSAHQAISQARENCWKSKWVIDLDIKSFFDNVDHELLLKAVDHVTETAWVRLYIRRWLKAEIELPNKQRLQPKRGVPQGGVISPLLANLFLHFAFDRWMQDNFKVISFERYADDMLIHCSTKHQAEYVLKTLKTRLLNCGLEVHPDKTKIVCCETRSNRNPAYRYEFDFLGHTFRRRCAKDKSGTRFTGFLPAISKQARKAIVKEIRCWKLQRWSGSSLEDIAAEINPKIRGWLNYYGKFYRSAMRFLWETLDPRLMKWFRHKYKSIKRRKSRAYKALERVKVENPFLFAHWQYALVCKDE